MKTTRGIYLNLKESEYYCNLKGLTFYFSSKQYLEKFINNVENYINTETMKMKVKYNIIISLDLFFMLSFYKKIEKRGFRVYDHLNKKEIMCENNLDIFIDDNFRNCMEAVKLNIKALMMNARNNKNFNDEKIKRVFSWDEIEKEICG